MQIYNLGTVAVSKFLEQENYGYICKYEVVVLVGGIPIVLFCVVLPRCVISVMVSWFRAYGFMLKNFTVELRCSQRQRSNSWAVNIYRLASFSFSTSLARLL